MNERLFLVLLLALFLGLFAAELLVVAWFGFRLELILFCFIMAVSLTGILVVVRLLLQQPPEIDSVSKRRAKEKRLDIMQDRLKNYSVDDEFLGRESVTQGKGNSPELPMTEKRGKHCTGETTSSIERAIRVHADRYGGLGQLLQMMEKIDELSFSRLVTNVGFGEVSREEVLVTIARMIEGDSRFMSDVVEREGERTSVLDGHSMERESFDEYIRRCMVGAEDVDERGDKGFSVELDSSALARGTSVPPADFSHDPKSVMSSLKRAGAQS